MTFFIGAFLGFSAWFIVRYLVAGIYTVDQNERAVKTIFGRADRVADKTVLDDPIAEALKPEEQERYAYPQVRVIPPGGPYFKWPWERIYKVSVATQTINMALDLETPSANQGGHMLDAVTKDQLNTGLTGQIRYRVCEKNLYAYLFGVKRPIVHVMGYFTSVLRERIAKRLARAGLCSRREAETWIVAGRVTINGCVIDTPALKDSNRFITLDGIRRVRIRRNYRERLIYVVGNKSFYLKLIGKCEKIMHAWEESKTTIEDV